MKFEGADAVLPGEAMTIRHQIVTQVAGWILFTGKRRSVVTVQAAWKCDRIVQSC